MSDLEAIALCIAFGFLGQAIGSIALILEIRSLADALSLTVTISTADLNGRLAQTPTEAKSRP